MRRPRVRHRDYFFSILRWRASDVPHLRQNRIRLAPSTSSLRARPCHRPSTFGTHWIPRVTRTDATQRDEPPLVRRTADPYGSPERGHSPRGRMSIERRRRRQRRRGAAGYGSGPRMCDAAGRLDMACRPQLPSARVDGFRRSAHAGLHRTLGRRQRPSLKLATRDRQRVGGIDLPELTRQLRRKAWVWFAPRSAFPKASPLLAGIGGKQFGRGPRGHISVPTSREPSRPSSSRPSTHSPPVSSLASPKRSCAM